MNKKAIACMALFFWASISWAAGTDPLTFVQSVIPDAIVDLRYSTENNFMKKAVYPADAKAILLKSVAERLSKAAAIFRKDGYRIKIYDAYRPRSVQWELWKVKPDAHYVAHPLKGSHHNRGIAVDMTLVDRENHEINMPSEYDDLSERGHHNSSLATEEQRKNADYLKSVMESVGFKATRTEWWHYHDVSKVGEPLLDVSMN